MMKLLKKRKLVLLSLAIAFVLLAAAAPALAMLNSVTVVKTNAFTPEEEIRAVLREPNWTGAEKTEALTLVPGKEVRKDPMITNTCGIEEYAAMRLVFRYGDGTAKLSGTDLRKLLRLLEIDWNSDWILCTGSTAAASAEQPLVFYCNGVLAPGKTTPPLFSAIRVKDQSNGMTEADLRWLQGIKITNGAIVNDPGGIGTFNIKIEGAAIQALGYSGAAAAQDDLKALFPPLI